AAAPPSVPAGPIAQPQATQQAQLSRESTPSAPPRLRSPLDDDDDFAFLDALGEPPAPAPAAPVAEAAAPVAEPEAPVAEAAAPVAEPEAPVAEAVVEPAARASELPVLMLDDEPPAPAD